MTIYSLYIFDRHCDCVYYQDWHRTRPIRAGPNDRPGVHRLPAPVTPGTRESIFSAGSNPHASLGHGAPPGPERLGQSAPPKKTSGLPFDEEAKLVYGVVLSLRNMVKKLSGKAARQPTLGSFHLDETCVKDEAFTSYKTAQYRLHLHETMTGFKFILLSDPDAEQLGFVLAKLYKGPFVDFVVRNPLVEMDSRERGIDNDHFRAAVDKYIRSLSIFQ